MGANLSPFFKNHRAQASGSGQSRFYCLFAFASLICFHRVEDAPALSSFAIQLTPSVVFFLNFNARFVFSGCVLRHFRISARVVPKPSKWASIIFRAFASSLSRTASDRWFPDCAFLSSFPMISAIRSTKSSAPNFQPRRISFQSASSACSPSPAHLCSRYIASCWRPISPS